MAFSIGWRRSLGLGFLALGLTASCGCLGFLHPIDKPAPTMLKPTEQLPKSCRDHVYIFIINGLDPVNYGNLTGLREYLLSLGFHKVYYGQLYHVPYFESEICKIHKADADAHFVLIGFSLGVNLAHTLAESVKEDGVKIDLLVYLSGNHPVAPMPRKQPDNVCETLNILASGCMRNFGVRDYAENVRLAHTCHFGAPTHPETLRELVDKLCHIAAKVPFVVPPDEFPRSPLLEEAPTPRPVKPPKATERDEWDFLKPVAQLPAPRTEATPMPPKTPTAVTSAK